MTHVPPMTHVHRPDCRHWRAMFDPPVECCERRVNVLALPAEDPRYRYCVCAYLFVCPDHGTTHVGTHD